MNDLNASAASTDLDVTLALPTALERIYEQSKFYYEEKGYVADRALMLGLSKLIGIKFLLEAIPGKYAGTKSLLDQTIEIWNRQISLGSVACEEFFRIGDDDNL